jgi:hypothetical protein
MFPTGGGKTALAEMGDQFNLWFILVSSDITSEDLSVTSFPHPF